LLRGHRFIQRGYASGHSAGGSENITAILHESTFLSLGITNGEYCSRKNKEKGKRKKEKVQTTQQSNGDVADCLFPFPFSFAAPTCPTPFPK
jgi:hypothetical protein